MRQTAFLASLLLVLAAAGGLAGWRSLDRARQDREELARQFGELRREVREARPSPAAAPAPAAPAAPAATATAAVVEELRRLREQVARLDDELALLRQQLAARPAATGEGELVVTPPPLPPPAPALAAVPEAQVPRAKLEPGLAAGFYEIPGGIFEMIAWQPEQLRAVRVEPQVDFDWGDAPPAEAVPADGFAARWTGFLEAPQEGEYLLITQSDDGVRLFVDDLAAIEHWDTHGPMTDRARLHLMPGLHRLRLEYFDGGGGAVCRLWWQPPGAEKPGPIPATSLLHDPAELPAAPLGPDATVVVEPVF